ncbi:MAG TPA: phosphate ABC transporter permease PtsA [Ruminococcaceae bacterium]|jgi:phosphate transport system permease protein|nr:phosphate ABC transporter permease PtsA [Oscillospiraceae bacterium]
MKPKFHRSSAKTTDKAATVALYMVADLFLVLLAAFTIYIFYRGAVAFKPEYLSFTREGIGIQFFNTIYLVLISLLISVPIGIAAGIYMAEYSGGGRISRFIRTCIETLASLPSIVVGLFGYLVFVVMTGSHWNLLAGALAVSILNIPSLTTVTEDALESVPELYREGSLGLGATHWQTITGVILPAALPRVLTGIVMAAGRGFGEAAALLFTSGMSSDVNFRNWNPWSRTSPLNLLRPADTLAVHIWALKTEGIEENAAQLSDLSSAVLMILVFAFSLGSRCIGDRLERKITGSEPKGSKKAWKRK